MTKAESPQFSIVTVVLNDHAGLETTRNHVINQTFADYGWIVVDGLSRDGKVELLQSWKYPNLTWISEPDKGLYDAMNQGLEMANGQYVCFLNAGDTFAGSDVLAPIDEILKQTACDLLYGDSYEIGVNGGHFLKKARDICTITYGMFTHHQLGITKGRLSQIFATPQITGSPATTSLLQPCINEDVRLFRFHLHYVVSKEWVFLRNMPSSVAKKFLRLTRFKKNLD